MVMANTVKVKFACTALNLGVAGGHERVVLDEIYDWDTTKHNAVTPNERPSRQPRSRVELILPANVNAAQGQFKKGQNYTVSFLEVT